MIIFLQQSVISYTGCQLNNGLTTSCVLLFTSAYQSAYLPTYQSAYRNHHSTEMAVLKIVSDALLVADRGDVTLLGLLDLSAASDTVDHIILIDRLCTSFGIRASVFSRIKLIY